MLKRASVKRATRLARDGKGTAHTALHAAHRSSIVSMLGRTGRTTGEAHCGHWRHCDSDGLWSCDIGKLDCEGVSRAYLSASRIDCQ